MKYETMLKILFLLLAKGKVSAKYIAQRFEISTRTVMRYLDTMSLANIPIIADPGRNGGFYIANTYKLPANFLTEKEFNAVVSTLSSYNQNIQNNSINSAIDKLLSIKSIDQRTVDVKSGNLIIDGSSWNGNDTTKNVISLISDAIEDNKKTLIGYVDRNGEETLRVIEPHVIVFKQGLWYVFAYCNLRKEFRLFKTGRIHSATLLKTKFIKQNVEKLDIPLDYWNTVKEGEDVVLKIDKSVISDVEEWLGIETIESVNGEFFANAKLPVDNGLISKILGYGDGVKVLGPVHLKEKVLSKALAVVNLYKK
jgi:predicted DNA-binding transcriptional regulator YafY